MIEDLIEDVVASTIVEDGVRLPRNFTVTIDQEPFAQLLRERQVPPNQTRQTLTVKVMGVSYVITVRSELDPDDWLPMLFSDSLH
jgi:hypothetical protein